MLSSSSPWPPTTALISAQAADPSPVAELQTVDDRGPTTTKLSRLGRVVPTVQFTTLSSTVDAEQGVKNQGRSRGHTARLSYMRSLFVKADRLLQRRRSAIPVSACLLSVLSCYYVAFRFRMQGRSCTYELAVGHTSYNGRQPSRYLYVRLIADDVRFAQLH